MKKISLSGILSLDSKGKRLQNKVAFTLVEIMVAITIFMIVMVSVLQIFGISLNISNKVDINRQLQENIKNLTETIAEDIRQNSIGGVKKENLDTYSKNSLDSGVILKIGDGGFVNKYYLSLDEENYSIIPKSNIGNCSDLKNNCFLVKDDGVSASRLTNSWMAIENLEFIVIGDKVKRLVIKMKARPSTKKGIPVDMIKNSRFDFETTLSERFIKTK